MTPRTHVPLLLPSNNTAPCDSGVEGIGLADSKVALYQNGPERGLCALQACSPGEVLLRVPLRLALTDHKDDQESNRLVYEVGGVCESVGACVYVMCVVLCGG